MADEQIVDPEKENSTPTVQEEPEQTPPAKDNGDEPAADPEKEELKKKVSDQARKLTGSKEEALRWKTKAEELESKFSEPEVPHMEVTSQDIAAFKALAKASGIPFVNDLQNLKAETYQERQQEAMNKFLTEHPEYNRAGDPDSDKAWEELKQEVTLYKQPTNPADWYKVLKKAHRAVADSPEVLLEKGKALGMAQANISEQSRMGSGAGGSSAPTQKKTPEQQTVTEMFKKIRPDYFK